MFAVRLFAEIGEINRLVFRLCELGPGYDQPSPVTPFFWSWIEIEGKVNEKDVGDVSLIPIIIGIIGIGKNPVKLLEGGILKPTQERDNDFKTQILCIEQNQYSTETNNLQKKPKAKKITK